MPTYIALLRAVNVAGHNIIAMADLRKAVEALGYTNVQTLLQSGNVVFQTTRQKCQSLEKQLVTQTTRQLKMSVDYMVFTDAEWLKIIEANPFQDEAKRDPSHVLIMSLKAEPTAKHVEALVASIKGPEKVYAKGRQLYIVYPPGIGKSKLTGALIERKLETRGTGRNWNTVMKLCDVTRK